MIRYMVQSLPFQRLLRVIIQRLATATTRNLNQFPINKEIWPKYSSLLIVTGYGVVDYKLFSIDFRVYVEICEDNGWATSSNKPRSTPAIHIGSASHRNPSQYFISLVIGEMLQWK